MRWRERPPRERRRLVVLGAVLLLAIVAAIPHVAVAWGRHRGLLGPSSLSDWKDHYGHAPWFDTWLPWTIGFPLVLLAVVSLAAALTLAVRRRSRAMLLGGLLFAFVALVAGVLQILAMMPLGAPGR